jgi:hypothetical protein
MFAGNIPKSCSQPLLLFIHWEFVIESSAPCSPPVLWGRFTILPLPLLSVLDYSLLFTLFSFVGGWFSLPRGCTGLCSWGRQGWVGESHMVCDAYLFISFYRFTQAALKLASGEKALRGFPWVRYPVCHRVQFWLMLCLLLVGGKKKRNMWGLYFPRWSIPCWLCHTGFLWLLGAIKSWFEGQSLKFLST